MLIRAFVHIRLQMRGYSARQNNGIAGLCRDISGQRHRDHATTLVVHILHLETAQIIGIFHRVLRFSLCFRFQGNKRTLHFLLILVREMRSGGVRSVLIIQTGDNIHFTVTFSLQTRSLVLEDIHRTLFGNKAQTINKHIGIIHRRSAQVCHTAETIHISNGGSRNFQHKLLPLSFFMNQLAGFKAVNRCPISLTYFSLQFCSNLRIVTR